MKAVICPVCKGEGQLYYPSQNDVNSGTGCYLPCYGCGGTDTQRGRGWVEVHEETATENDLHFTYTLWPRT